MQNDVVLTAFDDCVEESRWIKKGDIIIEAFDSIGSLWPVSLGHHYVAELDLDQLEVDDPVVISETNGRAEQIDETFAHYLYGYVKNNIFYVGEFKFDFSEYKDVGQYEGKFIKFKVDRVNVEFLSVRSLTTFDNF